MTMPASGGLAIVTGASRGIGRAVAEGLARAGLRLVLVGRGEADLRGAAARIEAPVEVVTADVASEAGVAAVARACPDGLDVLVHSAGLFHHGPVADVPAETWRALMAVNLQGPMLLTAACLPQLKRAGGQVVFVNSTAGLADSAATGAYGASKHALRVAAETMRRDLKGSGVRVFSLFPGRTDTAMQRQVLAAEGRPGARIPLLDPADVARVAIEALALPRRADVTDLVVRPVNA